MSEFIPDYMKKKDFIVIVILIIFANVVLYFFDKKMNGAIEVYSFSVVSNVIIFIFVGTIYFIWKKNIIKKFWERIRK